MALHLVTGYNGSAHITSADQGIFNAMAIGSGEYVLTNGNRFKAEIIDNNTVRIYDGSLMMNGRHVNLDSGSVIDVNIRTGTQGMYRNDIIYARYEVNRTTGIESVGLIVETGGDYPDVGSDPLNINNDSIVDGVTVHDMPLYRVVLEGLTITKVEPLFQLLAPMADFQHSFYKQNMLINGDFQCNQRGEKSYTDTGSVPKYTVDMWRAFAVNVDVLNEGVKITGKSIALQGYFTQFVQLGELKTVYYTISAMVDNKLCTFSLTMGAEAKEKDFGKFKITALCTSTWDNDLNAYNNKLKINICPIGTNSIIIQYVDLFEGEVAYPHRKEDYATALMRCEKYIKKKGYSSCVYISFPYDDSASSDQVIHRFPVAFDRMACKFNASINPPMIEELSWHFISLNRFEDGNIKESQVITNASGVQQIDVYNSQLHGIYTLETAGVYGSYVVTCEPRDK